MAAKAHSPSPHLTPCYFLYYPKKKSVLRRLFLILLFGLFRAVNTQNLSTRVPYGNHAFPFGDVNSDSCDDVVCHGFQPPNHIR